MQTQHIDFLKLLNGDIQYVVPPWQRRYCWGQAQIERLVEDLVAIAGAGSDATHYGGTLLTLPEPNAAGVLSVIRVIDGQQRLTTVSILLACIADKLEQDGPCNEWTAEIIREGRLTNPRMGSDRERKLKLQTGDEDDYRNGLYGKPGGPGAIAQAWKNARRLVEKHGAANLIAGLERLKVVRIDLSPSDDPQQIFESLNATGLSLTESEKVKNWLLIGLPETQQQHLHDRYWRDIKKHLGAEHSTQPIDIFLRDLMRWRTGENPGKDKTYERFRRWALNSGHEKDRESLCRELAELAKLYGILTGTAGPFGNKKVDMEIRHLQALRFDTHRPLTLRMLSEASASGNSHVNNSELAKALAGIAAWLTRLWLADKSTNGTNTAFARLAHRKKKYAMENFAENWLAEIRGLWRRHIRVPTDDEVRNGIRKRKAYGGTATQPTTAVLCALMEHEHGDEAPARDDLTIEHVMPRKLTPAWRHHLGSNADVVHRDRVDRLANLTLCGKGQNSGMRNAEFASKQAAYRKSPIGMTNRIASENEWNEGALNRRAEKIADLALRRWPWDDDGRGADGLRWRIDEGPWNSETKATQMFLNVTKALLDLDPENCRRLCGSGLSTNIHSAEKYPPGTKIGSNQFRDVPRHPKWVLSPHGSAKGLAELCIKFGERCGVVVDVKVPKVKPASEIESFWIQYKETTRGRPILKKCGKRKRTTLGHSHGDRIEVLLPKPQDDGFTDIEIYIISPSAGDDDDDQKRMRQISQAIFDSMPDQQISNDVEKQCKSGCTVRVIDEWMFADRSEWPNIAWWIHDQCDRLTQILRECSESSANSATP